MMNSLLLLVLIVSVVGSVITITVAAINLEKSAETVPRNYRINVTDSAVIGKRG